MPRIRAVCLCLALVPCLRSVLAGPTSCWVGNDAGMIGSPFFFAANCSRLFCFTVAFTDPAVAKNKSLSVGKGCDWMDIDRQCTQNGLVKLANRNVYCCDTDNCNDLMCNDKGECFAPPLTTTSVSLDTGATTLNSVETATEPSIETTTKSSQRPTIVGVLMAYFGAMLYSIDVWRGQV